MLGMHGHLDENEASSLALGFADHFRDGGARRSTFRNKLFATRSKRLLGSRLKQVKVLYSSKAVGSSRRKPDLLHSSAQEFHIAPNCRPIDQHGDPAVD